MTTTIPPEALEAAAIEINNRRYGTHLYSADDIARAACLAMLRAWPGGFTGSNAVASNAAGVPTWRERVYILPLQEKPND